MKRPSNRVKDSKPVAEDEILPEYDFSRASRNPYASKYSAGSAVVVLEPDVAAAFPSSKDANQALRALAGIIENHRSRPNSRVEDPDNASLNRYPTRRSWSRITRRNVASRASRFRLTKPRSTSSSRIVLGNLGSGAATNANSTGETNVQ